MISRWAESRRYHVRIFSVVCFYAFAMFLKINRKSQYLVYLFVVFRMATKWKHNKATLKTKYEALKELDKNRPNKEVALQFNVPGSTLLLLEKKKKIYRAFQNLSLKWQRVKVGTSEKINYILLKWFTSAWQQHTYQWPGFFRKSSPSSHMANRIYPKKWSWRSNRNFE